MLRNILKLETNATQTIAALFAYYFERITQKEFIQYVGGEGEGRRIKDIARKNGYILMNCKLYAYAVHVARREGRQLPRCGEYGVLPADASILRRLNLKHMDIPGYRRSGESGETVSKVLPRAFTLKEYQREVAALMQSKELKDYIGKFVHKKMAFLINSYGDSYVDICGFLREQALLAVYIKYPFYESSLHMLNIAKATVHNKGQSYITSSTAKSRQRLVKNDDGHFESVMVDMATMSEIEAPPNFGSELREGLSALASIEHNLPQHIKEFLLAAGGHHHAGFSEKLGMDNSEAVEDMDYEHYMLQLRQYYKLSEHRMEKLFENLRNYIYRCNNEPTSRAIAS